MKLIIATTNDHKIGEIKEILNSDIDFLTYKNFSDWPEVNETGHTFKENAFLKARSLAEKYGRAAVGDDSGLIVESLGGQPGVHSSRYAGIHATDVLNLQKLLKNLNNKTNKAAAFITTVAFVDKSGHEIFAEGKVTGKIIERPRGSAGFGYDPVFVPDGFGQTFAEMSPEEKNKLSHRGRAFRKLKALLQKKGYLA